MAQVIKMYRETTLPGTLQPYSIYYIAPTGSPNYVEVYVTDSSGTARRIIKQSDIQAMINSTIAAANELTIVANIAARDALSPTKVMYVYVQDATGDATVSSGGATYMYNPATSAWIKVSEAESMDVVLNWSNIVGKPSSSPAQIDAAVAATHTHSNKTQLDKVGEDAGGNFTYNGSIPYTKWESTTW